MHQTEKVNEKIGAELTQQPNNVTKPIVQCISADTPGQPCWGVVSEHVYSDYDCKYNTDGELYKILECEGHVGAPDGEPYKPQQAMKADMYTHQIIFSRPLHVIIDNTLVIKQEADHSIKTCPRCNVTIVGNWKFRNNPITGKSEVKCPSINCDSWTIKEL